MTKKSRQSKKATKSSKRTKVVAQPEEEPDTTTTFSPAEVSQPTPADPQAEVAERPVESHQRDGAADLASMITDGETTPKSTRSDAAKTNIKEGLRLHQLAGRPTKAQRTLVFGEEGYLLAPIPKPTPEKTKEKA
jgi:hypothetical protein